MSLFNNFTFNTNTFNDDNIRNLSANISTETSIVATLSKEGLQVALDTSSDVVGSLVYSSLAISGSIDTETDITSNISVDYIISGSIDTSSFVDVANNRVEISADITTSSDVSSTLTMLPLRLISASLDTSSDVSGGLIYSTIALSVEINTSSSVSGIAAPVRLVADIYLNETFVECNLNGDFTLQSNFDTTLTTIEVTPSVTRRIAVDMTSGSDVVAGFGLAKAFITTSSDVSGLLGNTYKIVSDEIITESTVETNAVLTLNTTIDITGESSISSPNCYAEDPEDECSNLPILSKTVTLAVEIDTSSTVSEPDAEIYIRLVAYPVYTDTSVNGIANDIFGLSIEIVDSSSGISGHIVYDTNLGGITINTESRLPFRIEPVTIASGSSVKGTLEAPEQLTSRRREVTYVFPVEKREKTYKTIIDRHYNIMKFYYSLSRIDEVLEYTRRSAVRELDSYRIDEIIETIDQYNKKLIDTLPAPIRLWSSNNDLKTITTGDRGIVQENPTGVFTDKQGHFAVYKGPKYINGQIVDTSE